MEARAAEPRPSLSVTDGIALVVGIVVGAGIFKTPALVAAATGSVAAVLGTWLLGGVISAVGALCYAELATTYPSAGGDYHFLRRAYGAPFSFLFGWARLTVIQTGSITLQAFLIGDYASSFLPLGEHSSALYAALVIVVITLLNVLGLRLATAAQRALTLATVAGLLVVVAAGLLGPVAAAPGPLAGGAPPTFGLAMIFVLLTYGGWSEAAYVSAELHDGRRAVLRTLLGGLALITLLYLLANVAYLRGLGIAGAGASEAVAADLLRGRLGELGALAITAIIIVAAASTMNATVFTGARGAYALGRDLPPLAHLGRWHPGARAPRNALVAQGVIALLLVGLGALTRSGFTAMVEYTAPVFWFFFLATALSLFVLRRTDGARPRGFRVPLYPVLPAAFAMTCAYMLFASVRHTGVGALVGIAVLAAGLPVLAGARRSPRPRETTRPRRTAHAQEPAPEHPRDPQPPLRTP